MDKDTKILWKLTLQGLFFATILGSTLIIFLCWHLWLLVNGHETIGFFAAIIVAFRIYSHLIMMLLRAQKERVQNKLKLTPLNKTIHKALKDSAILALLQLTYILLNNFSLFSLIESAILHFFYFTLNIYQHYYAKSLLSLSNEHTKKMPLYKIYGKQKS